MEGPLQRRGDLVGRLASVGGRPSQLRLPKGGDKCGCSPLPRQEGKKAVNVVDGMGRGEEIEVLFEGLRSDNPSGRGLVYCWQ